MKWFFGDGHHGVIGTPFSITLAIFILISGAGQKSICLTFVGALSVWLTISVFNWRRKQGR